MSTTHDVSNPETRDPRTRRTAAAWGLGVTAAVVVVGGAVMFSWMVDETRFDRPDPAFDALVSDVSGLPGVAQVQAGRWVEAPTFAGPTSWLGLTVSDAGLPALIEALCTTSYTDPVSVGIRVQTASGTAVDVGNGFDEPAFSSGTCPDLGVDAGPLLDEIDRLAPGLMAQASIRDDGALAVSALEAAPDAGFTEMLPLVTRTEELRNAAGLDPAGTVILESPSLSVPVTAADGDAYAALLTTLVQDHGVRSFAVVPDAAPPVDGIQVVASTSSHEAVERVVAASGIPAADLPVRFLSD